MPIKNIIFDLGGVIIDIDPERSFHAFKRHVNGLSENVYQHRLFHELETGKISPGPFRNAVRTELGIRLEDSVIDNCMTTMLGEIPAGRIEILEKMKTRYQTLLLSNTNAIHYDAVSRYLLKTHGAPSFETYFHKTYYSHLVGLRKPDIRIFELVIRENDIVPEETLYLDDMDEHLKSAQSLGIVTVKVTQENDLVNILKDF